MSETKRLQPRQLLADLREDRKAVEAAQARLDTALARRASRMLAGRDLGILPSVIAEAAGVSPARVSQVAPAPAPPAADTEAPVTPAAPAPSQLVRLPEEAPLLSGVASTARRFTPPSRVTVWVDLEARHGVDLGTSTFTLGGDTAAAVLLAVTALRVTPQRVFLVGRAPEDHTSPHSSRAEAVRSWGLTPTPGWQVLSHYLSDADAPVYRWRRLADGHELEVARMASWFGEGDYSCEQARDAWALLRDGIANRFDGGALLSSPATTGRELWRRTIGAGTSYPVMSTELRELLAVTSGQGRSELVRPNLEHWQAAGGLPGFTYLDGRFMYSALTWGMPVGAPVRYSAAALGALSGAEVTSLVRGRSRWLVSATVPEQWNRVGLLPAARDGGGWEYPAQPGRRFTTWVDGAEVWLARQLGWTVTLHEGIAWREGKPLNAWTERLQLLWHWLTHHEHTLAARGVRAILLFAIGAFATREHTVTHVVDTADAAKLPRHARVREVDGRLVASISEPMSQWQEQLAHPEWSALVWARARVRLLDHPLPGSDVRGGALHLHPRDVLAFRTDAIYTCSDPLWPDDGKPGRFRAKGHLQGYLPAPMNEGALFALRDAAEAAR